MLGRIRRDERGTVAVVTVIAATLLLGAAGLALDFGNTWARRGNLQVQADQAALYAARFLPANDDAGRQRAGRAAAYYLVCHPVSGQRDLDPTMPASCPSGPSSTDTGFTTWADNLVTAGKVSFPTINGSTGTYIQVTTPRANIKFGFGQVTGKKGSIQAKSATARVASPGSVSPIALSLNCLLSAAGNLPGGLGNSLSGILPLNYIAPGPLSPINNVSTKWPTTMTLNQSLTVADPTPLWSTPQNMSPGTLTATGAGWGTVVLGIGPEIRMYFALGDQSAATIDSLPYAPVTATSLLSLVGTGTFTVPTAVLSKVGTWHVKVAVRAAGSTTWSYSKVDTTFDVTIPSVTADLLGCARLIKTPRDLQQGTPGNLDYSLKTGLDHQVAVNPNLATLNMPSPLTVPNLLNALNSTTALLSCNNTPPNVYDSGGTHPTANCVMPEQGANTYKEFTDGILGAEETIPANSTTGAAAYQASGRLVCTSAWPCDQSFTMDGFPGRPISDESFNSYVKPERQGLLTEAMFFNLSTFLNNDVPVVTPQSALLPSLYRAHRFMWAPIISSPVAPNNANYYPVLTYRPIFITQDAPSGLSTVDMILAQTNVDSWVKSLLGIDPSHDHGLLMDSAGTTLRAMRFMTIEPSALPAVDDSYSGPVSDYVGTGPKVVRLVR